MSTTIQAEPSKPQNKKVQECRICNIAGFPNQLIGFEKIGEEHKHKSNQSDEKPLFKYRQIIDISAVTDLEEAKKLLSSGWEYKTSYPATIANIPHYILVKRE
jgi:hypothetical protein